MDHYTLPLSILAGGMALCLIFNGWPDLITINHITKNYYGGKEEE